MHHAIYFQVKKVVYLTKLYFYSMTIKNKIKLKKVKQNSNNMNSQPLPGGFGLAL